MRGKIRMFREGGEVDPVMSIIKSFFLLYFLNRKSCSNKI